MVARRPGEPDLRERADSALHGTEVEAIEELKPPVLAHDLDIHRVELEVQNDDLRLAHEELSVSRDKYRQLYDDAPVGYLTLDPRGLVHDANRTAARMLGCGRDQLLRSHLSRRLSRDAADELHRHLTRASMPASHDSIVITVAEPFREPMYLKLDTVPVDPDEHGATLYWTTLTSITAQKRSEERLTQLTAELEARVERRTRALSSANEELRRHIAEREAMEERLRQAHKMEALGRLAGGIAHDFNNLLLAIKLDLALLGRRLHDESDCREHVDDIDDAANRAASLTAQLLAFAKRDAAHPEEIDVTEVVRRMARMLRRVIGEDIRLVTHLDPATGCAFADASRLEQVILNLAINARDAVAPGGTITLETERVEIDQPPPGFEDAVPGAFVALRVRDDGCGITPDVAAHLFEPFFTTKHDDGGTGLGLATVYGIVKQSGGFIDVQSEPGRGTRFGVYVPGVHVHDAAPPSSRATEVSMPRGTETILLVEDLEMVRSATANLLRQHGYEVLEARCGEEALTRVERAGDPVDALITDIVMPGMNGRALAGALQDELPDLPVIYMSGYPGDQAPEPGAQYLQKPFTPDHLLTTLRAMLQPSR